MTALPTPSAARILAVVNGHRAAENLLLEGLYAATEVVALSLYELLAEARSET